MKALDGSGKSSVERCMDVYRVWEKYRDVLDENMIERLLERAPISFLTDEEFSEFSEQCDQKVLLGLMWQNTRLCGRQRDDAILKLSTAKSEILGLRDKLNCKVAGLSSRNNTLTKNTQSPSLTEMGTSVCQSSLTTPTVEKPWKFTGKLTPEQFHEVCAGVKQNRSPSALTIHCLLCFVATHTTTCICTSHLRQLLQPVGHINDENVKELSEALKENTTLKQLDLSCECSCTHFLFRVIEVSHTRNTSQQSTKLEHRERSIWWRRSRRTPRWRCSISLTTISQIRVRGPSTF